MKASLVRHVRQRAAGRCEYCRLPQEATSVPFEIDHIISEKHGRAHHRIQSRKRMLVLQ